MHRFLAVLLLCASIVAAAGADTPKARALSVPRPIKVPEASRLRLAGSGVFVLRVDKATGRVTTVDVQKSTGHSLLDRSAIEAFRKWRFAPGAVERVVAPLKFTAHSDVGQY